MKRCRLILFALLFALPSCSLLENDPWIKSFSGEPVYHDGYEPGGVHHGKRRPVADYEIVSRAATLSRRLKTRLR